MAAQAENAAAAGGAAAAGASLYVTGIDASVTDSELHGLFGKFGEVVSVEVCEDLSIGLSLRHGYVHYGNPQSAERALEELNFTPINGKPIRVMAFHQEPSTSKSDAENVLIKTSENKIDHRVLPENFLPKDEVKFTNVFVKNLCESTTKDDLKKIFGEFGWIRSAAVMTNEDGTSKCFGFVDYENAEDAARAVEYLDGQIFGEKKWYVGRAQTKHERQLRMKHGLESVKYAFDLRVLPNKAKFTNVCVKNLCESTTKFDLMKIFGEFGRIRSAAVMTNEDGTSKCFGFVDFENAEDAARAVEYLDGQIFGAKKWCVGRAQNKHERLLSMKHNLESVKYAFDNGCNLLVKNLDRCIDDEKLKELFSVFGSVTSYKVLRDGKGNSKERGFIAFSSAKEASDALSGMNGKVLLDKPLHVVIAKRREERRAQLQNSGKEIDHNALPETFPSSEDIRSCKVATRDSVHSNGYNWSMQNSGKEIDHNPLPETFSSSEDSRSCKVATRGFGHSTGYDFVQFSREATSQEGVGELYSVIRQFTGVISKLNSDIGNLNGSVVELHGNVMKLNGLLLNRKQVYMESSLTNEVELLVDRANLTDVFVKNFCELTTEENLKKIFGDFGLVTDAMVMRNADGTSKCFGFVSFKHSEDAARAVESLNGQRIEKTKLFSGRAQKKLRRVLEQKNSIEQPVKKAVNVEETVDKQCNLHVKNLDLSFDDEKLMELFSCFGSVTSCKCIGNRKTKRSLLGFVAFSSPEEASRALCELNGQIIFGKRLYVALAQKNHRIAQLQNVDKKLDCKALPEASVVSVDKKVDNGTNQRVEKRDHSIPHRRLSEVFSSVTSLNVSKVMPDQNNTNMGNGFGALSHPEQDAKSLSGKNAKLFSTKPLHVAQAQGKADRRVWSQGHMHSMSVTLIQNQQRNSRSTKAFPVQIDLNPPLAWKQQVQIIPRGHDYDSPLGGNFSVQYETGRQSLRDVVKTQSLHIGALASSLANAPSLNKGGRQVHSISLDQRRAAVNSSTCYNVHQLRTHRCWMRYCSRIVSRGRLNS